MTDADNRLAPAILVASEVPEVQRIKARFLDMAHALMAEGEPRYNVVYAFADAIIDLLATEHMKGDEEFLWTWHFLRAAEEGFGDWRRYLDLIDIMAEEIKRSRAAGGTGNPYQ